MSIRERAGGVIYRIRGAIDPETEVLREITDHFKGAMEAFGKGDTATEQEHLGAISQIIDERFLSVQVDTQPENSHP